MNKKRILLVDDEPMVLRVLRLQLENAGFSVETAPNGKVALEIVNATPPDALVTDIEMPHMSGEELCEKLQDQLPDRSFPIFVVTSLTALRHRQWSAKIPGLNFLEKPLSAKKLIAALKAYFENEHQVDSEAIV
jgi:DNA-binding response OmpR family regulator